MNDITEIANDLSYQTFSAKGSEHLSNSLTLEPKELYKLCWCLLISEDTTQCSVEQIRKHLHMDNLQDLNKIHKREVPALNILLESLHKWKSESLANTKQRLAFILWKCNSYFSKGIHMDARCKLTTVVAGTFITLFPHGTYSTRPKVGARLSRCAYQ